jgi:hypothetical protein
MNSKPSFRGNACPFHAPAHGTIHDSKSTASEQLALGLFVSLFLVRDEATTLFWSDLFHMCVMTV